MVFRSCKDEGQQAARGLPTSNTTAASPHPDNQPHQSPTPKGAEETWQFKQEDIAQAVAVGARQKAFDLNLPELGPYSLAYTRAGRHLLLGGRRGHLAVMEWQKQRLVCEVQVAETTRAVTFLHNEQFWAAAQKKYVYIYDKRGLEVHCLKEHTQPAALEFLPHHFLLASVGESGVLNYQVRCGFGVVGFSMGLAGGVWWGGLNLLGLSEQLLFFFRLLEASTLGGHLGALAGDLGCFPLDNEAEAFHPNHSTTCIPDPNPIKPL